MFRAPTRRWCNVMSYWHLWRESFSLICVNVDYVPSTFCFVTSKRGISNELFHVSIHPSSSSSSFVNTMVEHLHHHHFHETRNVSVLAFFYILWHNWLVTFVFAQINCIIFDLQAAKSIKALTRSQSARRSLLLLLFSSTSKRYIIVQISFGDKFCVIKVLLCNFLDMLFSNFPMHHAYEIFMFSRSDASARPRKKTVCKKTSPINNGKFFSFSHR